MLSTYICIISSKCLLDLFSEISKFPPSGFLISVAKIDYAFLIFVFPMTNEPLVSQCCVLYRWGNGCELRKNWVECKHPQDNTVMF